MTKVERLALDCIRSNDIHSFNVCYNLYKGALVDNCCSHDSEVNLLYAAIGINDYRIAGTLLKDERIIETLLKASSESKKLRETCIFLMAEKGKTNLLKMLIEIGGDIIIRCLRESTNVYAFDMFLEENFWDLTPVRVIAKFGHSELLQLLAEYGIKWRIDGDDELRVGALILAARYGHAETVQELLRINPVGPNNIHRYTELINESLQVAVCHGQYSAACALLDNGADALACTTESSTTPFEFAAALGYEDIFDRLLLSVNRRQNLDKFLVNALHVAAAGGHDKIILRLCARGGNEQEQRVMPRVHVDVRDKLKNTALVVAATAGNAHTISLLMRIGANSTNRNAFGQTALHLASKYGHVAAAQTLLESATDDERKQLIASQDDDNLQTPLHLALNQRDIKIVRLLLKYTQSLTMADKEGLTPLHVTSREGSAGAAGVQAIFETVKRINNDKQGRRGGRLDLGQMAICLTIDMQTPLHLAARFGDTEIVKLLLQYPQSLTTTDINGRTPLIQAAYSGKNAIIQTIFDVMKSTSEEERMAGRRQSCNVSKMTSMQDNSGYTALHAAVMCNTVDTVDTVKVLLRFPESLFKQDKQKRTPLMIAAGTGKLEELGLMLNCPEKKNRSKYELIAMQDADGNTALHHATMNGHVEAVKMIVDAIQDTRNSIKCNLRNDERHSALHVAVLLGDVECIKVLYGFQGDYPGAKKRLAVHHAACSDNYEVLQMLIEMKCPKQTDAKPISESLNTTDEDGYTPLMHCADRGDEKGVKLLLRYGAYAYVGKTCSGGMNILHLIVKLYAEHPLSQGGLLSTFSLILAHDSCKRELYDDYAEVEISDRRTGSGTIVYRMIAPVQLAAATASTELLRAMLDIISVTRSQNSTDYDMTCIVPRRLMNAPNTERIIFVMEPDRNIKYAELHPDDSCCEVIFKICKDDEIEEMLQIEPIEAFLTKFSCIRTAIFSVLFVLHVVYMLCFSVYVIPTCSVRITKSDPDYRFAGFLAWPILILLHEIICLCKVAATVYRRINFWKGVFDRSNANKTIVEDTFNLLHNTFKPLVNFITLPTTTYISYFGRLSHVLSLMFVAIVCTWFNKYCCAKNNTIDSYTEIVAAALVCGWLNTLEYVKGFTTIHAFSIIVRVVFIRDVLRILFIYIFVLIGFTLALYVYVDAEPTWSDLFGVDSTNTTLANVVYQLFGTIVGQGDLFQMSTEHESNFHYSSPLMIKLLFAIYVILSTIVLMNILIAMMNNTYKDIVGLRNTLWCVEALRFLNWISKDNVLWTIDAFRYLLSKTIFSNNPAGITAGVGSRRMKNRTKAALSNIARKQQLDLEIKETGELNTKLLEEMRTQLLALTDAVSQLKSMTGPSVSAPGRGMFSRSRDAQRDNEAIAGNVSIQSTRADTVY